MTPRIRFDGLVTPAHLYAAIRINVDFYARSTGSPAGTGIGTTFLLGDAKAARTFLVTCRHVIDQSYRPEPIHGTAIGVLRAYGTVADVRTGATIESWSLEFVDPVLTFPEDGSVDIAVLPWDSARESRWRSGAGFRTGNGSANHFGVEHIASEAEIAQLLVGDQIYITGFPGVGGAVSDVPILTTGVVASDPRAAGQIGGTTFPQEVLAHALSWSGMSGAPVLAHVRPTNSFMVVGVNAGHIKVDGAAAGAISRFVRAHHITPLLLA